MKLADIILESDEQQLANAIQQALGQELKDGDIDGDVKEGFGPVGILGFLLSANTILDLVGKYGAKLAKKLGFEKTGDKLNAIHHWAHENEKNVINVLAGIVKPFVKDDKQRQVIGQALFIVVLLALGTVAGVGAHKALKAAKYSDSGIKAAKVALKGRDIAVVGAEVAKDIRAAIKVAGAAASKIA